MRVTYPEGHKREAKACLFYGAKFAENKDNFIYIPVRSFSKDLEHHFAPSLPFGISILNYDDTKIIVEHNKTGEPISIEGVVTIPVEIIATCEDTEKLNTFITKAQKVYAEEIFDNEKKKGKVTSYMWDEYWEVINKKSNRPISSLCFSNNIHLELLDDLKCFFSKETQEEYTNFGIPYKMNILFEGYPGTGKSSLIYSLASELNMNVASITFDSELTDRQFIKAIKRVPKDTIIIIEDIDAAFKDRTEKGDFIKLTFSGLLNTLDGNCSVEKQVIIMTTNYKCNLDEALIRPGRVDKCVHFDYANKEQIKLIFGKFIKENTESLFKEFYSLIKNCKLTTAMLQHYLFSNRKNNKLIENIEELKQLSNEANYGKSNLQLYN